MKRTIVIGDLQGCYKEAVKLLELCEAKPDDHVIFTGDLLDRGPDNDLCVELARERERMQKAPACVMGNHEEKHLHYRTQELAGKDPHVVIPSHVATRMQLRDEHYDYIAGLPLYLRLPEHNAVVVHAGLYPGRPLEKQEARHLMHIQMINPYDKWGNPTGEMKTMWPSKAPTSWRFWTNFYNGPEKVIFGHSVFDKPLVTDKLYGIDGGACFGLKLHALILPEWCIVSVDGEADHGSRSRGRDGKSIAKYRVHDDVYTFS